MIEMANQIEEVSTFFLFTESKREFQNKAMVLMMKDVEERCK